MSGHSRRRQFGLLTATVDERDGVHILNSKDKSRQLSGRAVIVGAARISLRIKVEDDFAAGLLALIQEATDLRLDAIHDFGIDGIANVYVLPVGRSRRIILTADWENRHKNEQPNSRPKTFPAAR